MKLKTTNTRLESLESFKDRIMDDNESRNILGGTVDCDTADAKGVIHCDHLDMGSKDFGPDLTVDSISYKI